MMSVGASRRRLNELDQRSMDSSWTTKHSRDSAVSNGTSVHSVHSVSSGMDLPDRGQASAAVEPYMPDTAARGGAGARPRDVAPPPSRPTTNGRQVHSLRPDRSAAGLRAQIQAGAGAAATLPAARASPGNTGRTWVRKDRNKPENQQQDDQVEEEEERGKFAEDSDGDSVDKEDFDSDSTFDDHEDDENDRGDEENLDSKHLQYHMSRSNEQLLNKRWVPPGGRNGSGPGPLPPLPLPNKGYADSDASDYLPNPHKSKSLSSFLDPGSPTNIPPSKHALLPPLNSSRDHLPSPPPDPDRLRSSPELNRVGAAAKGPKPTPRPKPIPPARQGPLADPVYNNEPSLYTNRPPPVYDSVYEGSSLSGSHGFPTYDPVYDLAADNSRSTNRYEPVEFSPPSDPYSLAQAPDTDYMPRPLHSNLGRERLGPPPPVPPPQPSHPPSLPRAAGPQHRLPLESDIDSYMSDHGGQSLPRKYNPPSSIYSEDSTASSRFTEQLPHKPGAPSPSAYRPADSSYAPYTPHHLPLQDLTKSRERLNPQIPQPPPYSTMPMDRDGPRSRHGSRDKGLDHAGVPAQQHRPSPSSRHGSRERLDELPPPYSPGNGSLPLQAGAERGSRNDILYLGQGARPKLNESIETEI